jgi:hypothetical protein
MERSKIKPKLSKKIWQNISNKLWNFIKRCMFCRNLAKMDLKRYYLLQDQKSQKRPNGRIILFLENCFKKGQMASCTVHYASFFYNAQGAFQIIGDTIKRRV